MTEQPLKPKIALLILAAGASSRMGSPKQLLKWGDSTLLNHSINQAINSKAMGVFVVLGANHEIISKSIENTSVSLLENDDWKQGMGNTIAYGITHIQGLDYDGVLLMLADQPQVDTSFLNQLIDTFQSNSKNIIATAYSNGNGVPALFDKLYFKELCAFEGNKGAKSLIQDSLNKVLSISPKAPFLDIDTKEEYKLARDLN